MWDPYIKERFLTAIPQSSHRDIEPCIVSSMDFCFSVVFIDWQKCGFGLNISTGGVEPFAIAGHITFIYVKDGCQ